MALTTITVADNAEIVCCLFFIFAHSELRQPAPISSMSVIEKQSILTLLNLNAATQHPQHTNLLGKSDHTVDLFASIERRMFKSFELQIENTHTYTYIY